MNMIRACHMCWNKVSENQNVCNYCGNTDIFEHSPICQECGCDQLKESVWGDPEYQGGLMLVCPECEHHVQIG